MLVYDKNIFGSNREIDSNGYLRVDSCNITKTQVAPYLGREIPGWKDMGLESEKIYYVLRPEEELKKAASTFNNLPLTRKHIEIDVDDVPKNEIVGSLGDHTEFADGYLKNNLIIYDKKDIDLVMSGKKKELSCGYRYTPVQESGEWNGQHYDFRMTDIIGNHVALVKEGRAGHDVVVSDTIEKVKEKIMNIFKKKEIVEDSKKEDKVGVVMKEFKEGELKSGSGEKVTNPKQAMAIALSEAEKVKDEDIPSKDGNAEKDGEKSPENGEQEMKEEIKEVVEDKKDLEGKEKKAFAEGVDYGEKKEKEEPKKLDSEHESEGMKKADEKKAEEKKKAEDEDKEEKKEDKKEAEDKCAKDKCVKDEKPVEMAMDIDAIKEQVRQEVMNDFKAREEARKSVRSIVGDVNVFAFDSAEEIYKFACEKAGMNLDEIASYKSAFKGLCAAKGVKIMAMDASSVGSNKECLENIRVE